MKITNPTGIGTMHCKSSSGRLHCIYIRANEDPRVSTQTVENYLFTVRLHACASNQIFIYTTIQSYTSPVMSQKSYLGDEIPLCGVQRWVIPSCKWWWFVVSASNLSQNVFTYNTQTQPLASWFRVSGVEKLTCLGCL